MSRYSWRLLGPADAALVAALQRALNDLPQPLARALVFRGITSLSAARDFFRATHASLHDPFLMRGMEQAAGRLVRAIRQRERVLVYGDYDVDGTSSASMLTHFLRSHHLDVQCFIPDRFQHGYGLHIAGLDAARAFGATLVLALDCGITATDQAVYARDLGLDLIICDHHLAGTHLPQALILNPKQPGCAYPFKDLSACGVTFKLVQAACTLLGLPPEQAMVYLDFVALSTACDIVPLHGENRILLREGLDRMRSCPRPGLQALAETARLSVSRLSARNLSFGLGPRINAAGRVGSAMQAVELLLADRTDDTQLLALRLDAANDQRRALNQEVEKEALERARIHLSGALRHALVVHAPDWHPGVLGIVASRLVEAFSRPTIVLCTTDGHAKGSARSIDGFDMYEALAECADLLTSFGGHTHAAGVTLPLEHLANFRARLNDSAARRLTPDMLVPTLSVDSTLDLDAITPRFWAVLRQFEPHGAANAQPVFAATGLQVLGRPRLVGLSKNHLRLTVRPMRPHSRPRAVIGFGLGDSLPTVLDAQRKGLPIDIAFSIDEDSWDEHAPYRLRALDLRMTTTHDLFASPLAHSSEQRAGD